MKLAEALAERSDCQRRIAQIRTRLAGSARVQEGDQPLEDTAELLAQAERIFARLHELVAWINRVNARTPFDDTRTIADAIAERDVVGRRREFLTAVAEAASTRQDRYSRSEVRFVSTVPVGELRSGADRLARQYRQLDTRLQELNWQTELN